MYGNEENKERCSDEVNIPKDPAFEIEGKDESWKRETDKFETVFLRLEGKHGVA